MSRVVAGEGRAGQLALSRLAGKPLSVVLLAGAAAFSLFDGLPIWAVLGGWASYFIRGATLSDRAYNIACAVTGLGFGIIAQSLSLRLDPSLGILALPTALILVAIGIQAMEWITGVDNIPSYFLGVLAAFAAAMETSLDSYLILTAAVSVGAFTAALPDLVRLVLEIK